METKQNIRKSIYEKREQADELKVKQDSHIICNKVMKLPAYVEAEAVYAYIDCNNEVGTKEIIEAAWKVGKKVAAPRVEGRHLHFYEITSYDQLEPGCFGVWEPKKECQPAEYDEAIMIVPGVAFDKDRHRIGYGQGFYDRYLDSHPRHTTVAVAFDFQLVEQVPADEFDILPQMLITETAVYTEER